MYAFGVRRVSRRFDIFWIAAIHCRFGIAARPRAASIWSAARPRTALEYFGLRHVSCRFRIAVRQSDSTHHTPEGHRGQFTHVHPLVSSHFRTSYIHHCAQCYLQGKETMSKKLLIQSILKMRYILWFQTALTAEPNRCNFFTTFHYRYTLCTHSNL